MDKDGSVAFFVSEDVSVTVMPICPYSGRWFIRLKSTLRDIRQTQKKI